MRAFCNFLFCKLQLFFEIDPGGFHPCQQGEGVPVASLPGYRFGALLRNRHKKENFFDKSNNNGFRTLLRFPQRQSVPVYNSGQPKFQQFGSSHTYGAFDCERCSIRNAMHYFMSLQDEPEWLQFTNFYKRPRQWSAFSRYYDSYSNSISVRWNGTSVFQWGPVVC